MMCCLIKPFEKKIVLISLNCMKSYITSLILSSDIFAKSRGWASKWKTVEYYILRSVIFI